MCVFFVYFVLSVSFHAIFSVTCLNVSIFYETNCIYVNQSSFRFICITLFRWRYSTIRSGEHIENNCWGCHWLFKKRRIYVSGYSLSVSCPLAISKQFDLCTFYSYHCFMVVCLYLFCKAYNVYGPDLSCLLSPALSLSSQAWRSRSVVWEIISLWSSSQRSSGFQCKNGLSQPLPL